MTPPDLAVFDLDGTLTRRDTLLPFLVRVAGRARAAYGLVRAAPDLVRARRDRAKRDRAKEALLSRTLRGRLVAAVAADADAYAEALAAGQLRPDTLARLRWHQDQGHECVIVSASLALYVEPLARRLGVGRVLATDLEVGRDGRLSGRIAGANCRAGEKIRRLDLAFGDRPIEWAYGDSVDDAPVLERARYGTLVGREPMAAAGA